jgi:hypothetical protein
MSNKVLSYVIQAVDKSTQVIADVKAKVNDLGGSIRKAFGGVGQWAVRELNGLAESPMKAAVAMGLAAAAGQTWSNVLRTLGDRARAARDLLASIVSENLTNTIERQAKAYDRLTESIDRAAAAGDAMSQAQRSGAGAAADVRTGKLEADKAEALAKMPANDQAGRDKVGAEYDAKIQQSKLDAKDTAATMDVADAERKAAENAERRANAQERIKRLTGQIAAENKRLGAASDAYAREGNGVGDHLRGTLVAVGTRDPSKALESRYRDKNFAKARVDESQGRLEKLSKELNEARKDKEDADSMAPSLATDIASAKTAKGGISDDRRRAAAEASDALAVLAAEAEKAAAKLAAGQAKKANAAAREEQAEALKDDAAALQAHADAMGAAADDLRRKADDINRQWGGGGGGGGGAAGGGRGGGRGGKGGAGAFAEWQAGGEAAKEAGEKDAKFEKALAKAREKEERFGRVTKKSDKQLIAFDNERQGQMKRAADLKAEEAQLRAAEKLHREQALALQREVRDLLKQNLTMGGANAGGPE